jgi:hypothetical protein
MIGIIFGCLVITFGTILLVEFIERTSHHEE